ncbi:hypothetical protein NDN08_002743 [Rhodosorus marinus]|uniref:HTH myb-type domain-containing protein n=1 Tax=Rhodosorus marinus TaxID=101924 RepID=A0AAV8UUM1_9RHOD|nr:hypothetical protein NDN08_002743 [Rhodosorus marinus]
MLMIDADGEGSLMCDGDTSEETYGLKDWDRHDNGDDMNTSSWFESTIEDESGKEFSLITSDAASQELILRQQKRIDELEADLNNAQADIKRLKMQAAQIAEEKRQKKSSGSEKRSSSRYWTSEEHQRFLEGLAMYGHRDVKAISKHVGTRNATQVRTHAQKYYLRLSRQAGKSAKGVSSPMSSKTAASSENSRSSKEQGKLKTAAVH